MSVLTNIEIERLTGFQILETEDGLENYTLIFRIQSGDEWACVADRQILQKLAGAILRRATDSESENS
jgi:hypothetical protein